MKKEKTPKNHFDPKKSILSLPVFWGLSGIIVAFSAISSLLIVANSNLSYDFSYSGFNNAIQIFKFPLGFLALLIPLIALMNANHRSEQTKAQILYAESEATFSNYYKHIEEFEKYLDSHLDNNIAVASKRDLHYKLYPEARSGDFNINRALKKNINTCLVSSFSLLYPPKTYTYSEIEDLAELLSVQLQPIFDTLGVKTVDSIRESNKVYRDFFIIKAKINAIKTIIKYDQREEVSNIELLSEIRVNEIKRINDHNKQDIVEFFDPQKNEHKIKSLMIERSLQDKS